MHTHDSNDGIGSDEESTLDVALHCGECGVLLTLTLDTPIGLGGVDVRTPVPLCSAPCVEANVERIAQVWDRCRCGAVVGSREYLKTSRKGIIGCRACNYSGQRSSAGVRHYWARSGGALCTPPGQSSSGKQATIRRSQVDCPACLHALMVESEIARTQQGRRP